MAGIPAPLGIGTVALSDGASVKGFICEASGIKGATDITNLGDWRAYLAQGGVLA
jgi:allophanate hydrolase